MQFGYAYGSNDTQC